MENEGKQSLSNLTQNVIELLKNSHGEELEISEIETRLKANKRRLYDVINVLCGVGLIERSGKSKLRWTNQISDSVNQSPPSALLAQESEIDQMTTFIDKALEELPYTEDFKQNAWLSAEDIALLDPQKTMSLFVLHGPPSMTIQVYDDDVNGGHHLICHAPEGKIQFTDVTLQ